MTQARYVMLATIGGQPQVVTFALDALLSQGVAIQEVIVIHLSPQAGSHHTGQALPRLAEEFAGGLYAGRPCRLRLFPLYAGAERTPLRDIDDDAAAAAAWHAIYGLVAELKAQGHALQVCISGGRRMLALLALSAAMLHFDHNDHLWHMFTPNDFVKRARDGAIMHARPEDGVRLIQVPVAPWGAYFPALRTLAQISPQEAVAARTRWLDSAERARCQAVVERLTPRQLETLQALASGQNPQQVAETLCITVKTVHAHKTVILAECRNAWNLPDDLRLDYYFLRERFGRFFQQP